MEQIPNYCYIEFEKLVKSPYSVLLAIISFSLAAFMLFDFKNSINESFEIRRFSFPQTDFVEFFMEKLSSRLHLLSYLLAVSICLLSIELDLQGKFLSRSIFTLPVNIVSYLIAKILICSAFVIIATGVLHFAIPPLVISAFENRSVNLPDPIGETVVFHWVVQSFFLIPIVSFIVAYSVIIKQRILISFVLFFLFYFMASGLSYFYPLSLLSKFSLINSKHAGLSYYLIGFISVAICVMSSSYALTKRKYA